MCKFLLVAITSSSTKQMRRIKKTALAFLLLPTITFSSFAISNDSSYQYTGDHGLDFSQLSRGPIKIDQFRDERENISLPISFSKEIPSIVRAGIEQAFLSGNAKLVPDNENLLISGVLTTAEIQDNKLILRTKLSLSNKGKSIWNSTLFSKVIINPEDKDIDEESVGNALNKAIDKLIEELLYDDYFLLEILD